MGTRVAAAERMLPRAGDIAADGWEERTFWDQAMAGGLS